MPTTWAEQGCEKCRDAWSSLAKNVDRSMILTLKRGETGVLYKCSLCGALWDESMGNKGPAEITREEARSRYGYDGSVVFEIPAPPFASFGHTGDYARACEGSIVRLITATSTDDRFRISVEGEWLRFSLRQAAEEYRLDRAFFFSIALDERVLGISLATLRLVFRGINDETASLPVLTSPGDHGDWYVELHRKMRSAALPVPVKVTG